MGKDNKKNKPYTKEKIDKLIEKNKDRILSFYKELEIEYSESGIYNKHDYISVLFDLRDYQLYKHVSGQAISMFLYEGINEGYVIEVYRFETGVSVNLKVVHHIN